jgi:bifunctional non-homologous end joining protein LigD
LKQKRCLLDGEVVAFDPAENRPVFQKVLQRERSGTAGSSDAAISYVLFDLLQEGDEDLRDRPYRERHERLKQLFPGEPSPSLFVTDLFSDGEALWRWVETNGWEGMVSKRLASPYREGKRHQDWFKKKTAVVSDVQIVGVVIREGRVASLVMVRDGQFYGRVSLGLNERSKQIIRQYAVSQLAPDSPFRTMPAELKGEQVLWLAKPFVCRVRGLEVTSAGLLRHPKLEAIDLTRLAVAD